MNSLIELTTLANSSYDCAPMYWALHRCNT